MRRIENEKRVVALMIGIYCRRHHAHEGMACKGGLCPECADLLEYAHRRLDRCPHGERKPSCRKCTIHCYAPMQKEAIRGVMRYVGPRMLFIHPVAAIRHLLNELR